MEHRRSPNPQAGRSTARLRFSVLAVVASVSIAALAQPVSAPLIQPVDLVYQGAFRLPPRAPDEASFDFGGTALAYNAARDSLFIVGHDWFQRVAEINIPGATKSATPGGLTAATVLQAPVDSLRGRIGQIGSGTAKIGGLLVWGDSLVASAYLYYDGTGGQVLSHFRGGLELTRSADPVGPVQVGSGPAGFVSGYMTPIPAEWQAQLGGPALTGQCCLSIISRTSFGPSVSVFDPARVGVTSPVPATRVLGYPEDHRTLGDCDAQGTLFNCATTMAGVVFPAGTRSVLFFGRQGLGPYCYGEGSACGDPASTSKGTHAYPYAYQVWAYDVLDLILVKNGRKKPWEIRPYRTWTFELPFQHSSRQLNGVAYDPVKGRVFVSAAYGDEGRPIIHVFRLAK